MNKLLIFSMSIIILFSCTNNKRDYVLLKIKEPISIKGQAKEFEVSLPSQIEWINSNLYLFRVNGCTAKVFDDINGTNIADFGRMGPGPDEFISPYYGGYDEENNKIYISDISLNLFREYEIVKQNDTLIFKRCTSKKILRDNLSFRATIHLKNGYTIGQTIAGTNKLFILFDSEMKVHHTFGENPVKGIETTDMYPFAGLLTAYENQFVFAAMHYGYIVSYIISDNGNVTKLWEHYLSRPYYEMHANKFKWDKERNRLGFYDVKMSNKYIYTLYSGKKDSPDNYIPDNMLIFDLNGNLEQNYLLDKQSGRLAIAHDSIAYTLYSVPDVGIAKYPLNH
ncbi:BF3164 family lipoprotein [Parabacteroides bouchesdurhonensis]|uniref:BF3164 family lipoprotein n=1 Tax=Parabacteroides bouchesdurhonensis TaxID=1936995 RepID=UPI000C82E573|nr:BF3164 family lipoprotein [Parabacteroides bouchesdurhonensis]